MKDETYESTKSATLAPWRSRNAPGAEYGEILDANGNWVARVHRRNSEDATGLECQANSFLIQAAPDLYRALRQLLNLVPKPRFSTSDDEIPRARTAAMAALMKAQMGVRVDE